MKKFILLLIFFAFAHLGISQENIVPFVEKYKRHFLPQQQKFEAPFWDFLKKNELEKIEDEELIAALKEITDKTYEVKFYFYTLENRLSGLQDFTIFCATEEGNYIYYVILSEINEAVDGFNVAYDYAEGEYSESAYGNFTNKLEYHLRIDGFAEPFEDDGILYEGEESISQFKYFITEDGMVEYMELESE